MNILFIISVLTFCVINFMVSRKLGEKVMLLEKKINKVVNSDDHN